MKHPQHISFVFHYSDSLDVHTLDSERGLGYIDGIRCLHARSDLYFLMDVFFFSTTPLQTSPLIQLYQMGNRG